MLSLLATCVFLAAGVPAVEPTPAEPRLFSNENGLAVVLGHELAEVSYVATHCAALERYTQQVLAVPAFPTALNGVAQPKARIEVIDLPGQPDVSVRILSGQVVVSVRVTTPSQAAQQAAEAAARAWVARAAFAAGRPLTASEPWVTQALAAEVRALLRPSLVDLWYREGRVQPPALLADILQGRGSEREAFLFWRALRHDLGPSSEQTRVLIASAQGAEVRKTLATLAKAEDTWWLTARANLLLARNPVSLGIRESAEALDDITRFIFDLGQGDVVLTGPQVVRQRDAAGVKQGMEARLNNLRREILRQNPVYHNAWRTLGAWLERFPQADPAELDQIWSDFEKELRTATALGQEIKGVLAEPTVK